MAIEERAAAQEMPNPCYENRVLLSYKAALRLPQSASHIPAAITGGWLRMGV